MADATSGEYFAAPKPNPKLKDLNFLVGKWKLTGNFRATDYGPAGTIEGEDTFEWFNEYFLKHTWKQPLGTGMEFLGYEEDEEENSIVTHYFDNNGPYSRNGGSIYRGEMRNKSYVQCGPARITYTPSEDGKVVKYTAEMSVDGKSHGLDAPDSAWAKWLEATYTKID